MTENMFGAPQYDAGGGSDNRTKVLALGLVAALALGGGGFYYLTSSGSDDVVATPAVQNRRPVTKPVTKPAAKTAAKPAVKPAVLPVKTTVRIGRDPFRALYVQPVAASAGAPTATSTTPTAGTTTPGVTTGANYKLKLVRISPNSTGAKIFTFSYGGVSQDVVTAQRFGKYGELVTLAWFRSPKGVPTGALIQVGDDDPVDIKIGETITVQ